MDLSFRVWGGAALDIRMKRCRCGWIIGPSRVLERILRCTGRFRAFAWIQPASLKARGP